MNRVFLILLSTLAIISAVDAESVESASDPQILLEQARKVGPGQEESIIAAAGTSTYLPEKVWRQSFSRSGGFEWKKYYQRSEGDVKGDLVATKILHYSNNDISYIFWLDSKKRLLSYQRKIQQTSLMSLPEESLELMLVAFVEFDREGKFQKMWQHILLVNDAKKIAAFSEFDINNDGKLMNKRNGDFDYFQLVR